MIAAAAATTITATIERSPWDAITPHAISAVSPGTGSPNDSSATSAKRSGRAQSPWAWKKLVIDASTVTAPAQPTRRPVRRGAYASPFPRCRPPVAGAGFLRGLWLMEPQSDDSRPSAVADALGGAAVYSARVAARAWRGRLET